MYLLNSSLARSTAYTYKSALKHYTIFHHNYYPEEIILPASVEHVAQIITVYYHRSLKSTTIYTFISAHAYVHKIQGLPNPTTP